MQARFHKGSTNAPISGIAALAASMLSGSSIEERGAVMRERIVRGHYRGMPVELRFEEVQTRRNGIQPRADVTLFADVADAPIRLGGPRVYSAPYERRAAFPQRELVDFCLTGAPQLLLARLANGPLGHRLTQMPIASIDVGPYAQRISAPEAGIVLGVHGWPETPAAIALLLDTVIGLHDAIHAIVPELVGPNIRSLIHHPEVVLHAHGRAKAHGIAIAVVAAALATVVVLGCLATTALVLS